MAGQRITPHPILRLFPIVPGPASFRQPERLKPRPATGLPELGARTTLQPGLLFNYIGVAEPGHSHREQEIVFHLWLEQSVAAVSMP